jgi:hypothetical protein
MERLIKTDKQISVVYKGELYVGRVVEEKVAKTGNHIIVFKTDGDGYRSFIANKIESVE